mgnify:CR=1 FL=1
MKLCPISQHVSFETLKGARITSPEGAVHIIVGFDFELMHHDVHLKTRQVEDYTVSDRTINSLPWSALKDGEIQLDTADPSIRYINYS